MVTSETNRTDSTPQTSQSESREQVPTGNLVDLEGGAEQTTVPSPSPAGTSADIPPVTPRQMMESSISPVLPPLPESLSGFSIILDFLQPNTPDNPAESIAVSASDLASPLEVRESDTETVVSPTRSLFPSVSQEFENIVTSPQGTKMSHAKAAELRNRNQQLEEQCDGWKKKYDELERRHRELERKCQDLEKNLADAVAVGADWSNMSFSH